MTSPLLRHPYKPGGYNTTLASSLTVEVTESARSTANPKSVVVPGCITGDVLYVLGGGDGGLGSGNAVTAVAVSTTAGTTGAWSTVTEQLTTGVGNGCWLGAYSATVTADGDVTVSVNRTQVSTARTWRFWVSRVRNSSGLGSFATSYTLSNTQAVSIVADDGAAVLFQLAAWDIGLATGVPQPARANVVENADDANYYDVSCFWVAETAGTRNYGTSVAGSANIRCLALEILPIVAGSVNAPAENALWTLTAQDAGPSVAVAAECAVWTVAGLDVAVTTLATAESATWSMTALDATVATSGGTNAPADVAPLALAATDAVTQVATVTVEAALAVAGMDAALTLSIMAESASATALAQAPRVDLQVNVDLASIAVVADNPTVFVTRIADAEVVAFTMDAQSTTALISAMAEAAVMGIAANDPVVLTGTVISAQNAPLAVAAQDAVAATSGSVLAEVATLGFVANTNGVDIGTAPVTAAMVITPDNGRSVIVTVAEIATLQLLGYDGATFQPSGFMSVVDVMTSDIDVLFPSVSGNHGDDQSGVSMETIERQGSTMTGGGDE